MQLMSASGSIKQNEQQQQQKQQQSQHRSSKETLPQIIVAHGCTA